MSRIILTYLKLFLFLALIGVLCVSLDPAGGFEEPGKYEYDRAKLLGHMLKKNLEADHFSHKKIDDYLSGAAFGLYLRQLDVQKKFLLKEDVERLNVYSGLIDNEISSGKMELPEAGVNILFRRVAQVRQMTREILATDFDFTIHEAVETDTEKLDYCRTEGELRERWRKILKLQALQKYLNLTEDEVSSAGSSSGKGEHKKSPPGDIHRSSREKILRSYEAFFARMLQEREREHYDRYFSAVTRAFDPHTDYMPPTNKEDFDISMRGSLEGIGATLREEDGYIKVVSLLPGGPAFRQGQLHAEDYILKVGEGKNEPVDITGMRVTDAVRLIRGKRGTEVRLTVRKQDASLHIIPIVRDVVQIEETFVKGSALKDETGGHTIGYIKIPAFYRDFDKTRNGGSGRNSTDDVINELKKFGAQNISGLVIDLRNNGGGALTDAIRTAGLFIKTGPIVQVKGSDGKITVLADDDPGISYNGPIVILVNKISASASEILAGALQDYGRAVILGSEHTHGKGTVQSIIDLDKGITFQNTARLKPLGALKVTIQKFYRISGESTQYKGIKSDIVLPDGLNSLKTGEQYLEFALPWDTVPPAPYTKWTHLQADVTDLRAGSMKRIMSNQDFINIDMEVKKVVERQKQTMQSLNIDIVRKEHEEARKRSEKAGGDLHADIEKKLPAEQLTVEKKRELWVKEVNGDVYVREAVSVLGDMLMSKPGVSMN